MSPEAILAALFEMDVQAVYASPGHVDLMCERRDVPLKAIALAKPYAAEISVYLDKRRCRHQDRTQWRETADAHRSGWIKTTCCICGGFVGYRFDDLLTVHAKRQTCGPEKKQTQKTVPLGKGFELAAREMRLQGVEH